VFPFVTGESDIINTVGKLIVLNPDGHSLN